MSAPTPLDIVEVEPGVYSVLDQGRSYEVRLEGDQAEVRGLAFQIEDEVENGTNAGGRSGVVKIASPMPGRVIRVLVAAGDTVKAGQGIVVVEAMKMQNEMKSPKAGVVKQLNAQAGGTVAAREVIALIE